MIRSVCVAPLAAVVLLGACTMSPIGARRVDSNTQLAGDPPSVSPSVRRAPVAQPGPLERAAQADGRAEAESEALAAQVQREAGASGEKPTLMAATSEYSPAVPKPTATTSDLARMPATTFLPTVAAARAG